jgi:hypothetical protein
MNVSLIAIDANLIVPYFEVRPGGIGTLMGI